MDPVELSKRNGRRGGIHRAATRTVRARCDALARERRFEVLAGGEVIPDANMPLGESLVRNLCLRHPVGREDAAASP